MLMYTYIHVNIHTYTCMSMCSTVCPLLPYFTDNFQSVRLISRKFMRKITRWMSCAMDGTRVRLNRAPPCSC